MPPTQLFVDGKAPVAIGNAANRSRSSALGRRRPGIPILAVRHSFNYCCFILLIITYYIITFTIILINYYYIIIIIIETQKKKG